MSLKPYPEYKYSGFEWLGNIPKIWRLNKFRHVFAESSEVNGPSPVGEMLSISGYRGVELKSYDDENQKRSADQLETYRVVRVGQLAVNTMWLNYAGLGVSSFEGHVSPAYRAYWIHPSMDRRYVHHLMRSAVFVDGYTANLVGIRPNSLQMSRPTLMSFPVIVPSIAEQQTIADYLDRETAEIDAFIADQEELIVLLAERRVATITQAVTKGLHPDTPMKDSGDKWLGRVPENWSVVSVSRFVRFGNGSDYKHVEVTDGGYPVIGSGGEFRRASEYLFDGESVLFGRKGTVDKPLHINGKFWTVDTMYFTRIDVQNVLPKFLYYWALRFPFDFYVTNTALPSMTQTDLGSAKMGLPSLEDQEVISAYLDGETAKIDAAIADAREAIALSKERRAGVIDAAVTGKIDVRGFVAPAIMEEGTSVGVE